MGPKAGLEFFQAMGLMAALFSDRGREKKNQKETNPQQPSTTAGAHRQQLQPTDTQKYK